MQFYTLLISSSDKASQASLAGPNGASHTCMRAKVGTCDRSGEGNYSSMRAPLRSCNMRQAATEAKIINTYTKSRLCCKSGWAPIGVKLPPIAVW
eukprot:6484555-Amphidinium_carterae.2